MKKDFSDVRAYDTIVAQGKSIGAQIATLRVAVISYEHHPIHSGGTGSIGDIIDNHIAETIQSGKLINEVSLIFETMEQQQAIREMYQPK